MAIEKDKCIAQFSELLQEAVNREAESSPATVTASSPLIGPDAVISSLGLVSFIADAEILLSEEHELDVTLVSEDALSRSKSPFQTILTLADYADELAAADAQ